MPLPERTPQELAVISFMTDKLVDVWIAADEILQWDGSYPSGQATAARGALDVALTTALSAVSNVAFAPNANKAAITSRISIVIELSIASLEGSDLQQIAVLGTNSRDTARMAMGEAVTLVSAAICGRLPAP